MQNSKETYSSASYASGAGSSGYSSSGTNINTNSPYGSNTNSSSGGYSSYVTGGSGGVGEGGANESSYASNSSNYDIPKTDKLGSPLVHNEALAQEVLSKAGPAYTYQRKDYSHDIGALASSSHADITASSTSSYQDYSQNQSAYSGYGNYDENSANIIKIDPPPLFSSSSVINQDPDPIRIVKPNNQNIVYKQQVNIRYLQPPTPPPPAPIIIREKQLAAPPSQPPIIIRQTAPAPPTPPPLTIREKAPTPPPVLEPTIIERPIPPPPAPPRQVIIERVPAPPAKPRPIIYEKWLPYKSNKRPVIVQKVKQPPAQPPPKNVIIEYEKPKAVAIRQVIEEGIFRVDPATYQSAQMNGEIRFVDRITDLPIENSRILAQLNLEASNRSNENNLYAQFLSSSSVNSNTNSSNNFGSSSNSNYNNCEVEYETITTSVPESLAAKIIAEAQAAGAISRSANNTSYN